MSKRILSGFLLVFLCVQILTANALEIQPITSEGNFENSVSFDDFDLANGDYTTAISIAEKRYTDSFIVKYRDGSYSLPNAQTKIRENNNFVKIVNDTFLSIREAKYEKRETIISQLEKIDCANFTLVTGDEFVISAKTDETTVQFLEWKDSYEIIALPEAIEPEAFMQEVLENSDDIEFIQPNYKLELYDTNTYDISIDMNEVIEPVPTAETQIEEVISDVEETNNAVPEVTDNPEVTDSPEDVIDVDFLTYDRTSDLEAAWNTATGEGVTVAVIDGGVDITHPLISSKVKNAWDMVNGCELIYTAENAVDSRHGTHVTGIIASSAPDADIIPIKVFENGQAYTSDIIDAIAYAEGNGADIVNCSFGCTDENAALLEAMRDSDMLFVCAAGNNRMDLSETPIYPACFNLDNIISVTSLNDDLGLSYYSNYNTEYVDIAAWGRDIESAWPNGETAIMNGTSMAAAFVTAGAAMAKELEVSDIKSYIKATANKLSNLQSTVDDGNKINYYRLVNNITTGGYVEVNPVDDFDVHGYQRTPSENWELFCSLDNVQVAGGSDYTLVLKADGTVWGWGKNSCHIFSSNSSTHVTTPVQITGLTDIVQIGAGAYHAIALKADGTVWTWGNNSYGVLGDGTTVSYKFPPAMIPGITEVEQVSTKNTHNLLLKGDGTVLGWGRSTYGQLGTNTDNVLVPSVCSFPANIDKISAGNNVSIGITENGNVWLCGYNYFGQLGLGDGSTRYTPVQVPNFTNCIDATTAWQQIYLLKSDNTVWASGSNEYGQLGLGDTNNRNIFTKITSLDNIVDFYGGEEFFVALDNEGVVYTCGRNQYGQLGNGTQVESNVPVQVSGLPFITQVAAGTNFALAIDEESQLWSWGNNAYYQLGDGSNSLRTQPCKVYGEVNDVQGDVYTDAHEIVSNHTVSSSLNGVYDEDWYVFIPKYSGIYTFTLTSGFNITVKSGDTYIYNTANGVEMIAGNEYYIGVVNRGIGYDETKEYTFRINGIPEKTVSINANGSFNLVTSVTNMTSISDMVFELTYDASKLAVTDLVAPTYATELATGTVNGYPVEIISVGDGIIKYRYTEDYENVTFSGIVNIVKFNTLVTGETIIALNIY